MVDRPSLRIPYWIAQDGPTSTMLADIPVYEIHILIRDIMSPRIEHSDVLCNLFSRLCRTDYSTSELSASSYLAKN